MIVVIVEQFSKWVFKIPGTIIGGKGVEQTS